MSQPRPSDDPNDPLNWPRWRKHWNCALASFYSMLVFSIINAATPTWTPMGEQLNFSDADLNNSYAIGCATLAIGGFILIPFALKFGRRPIYIISLALQFAISIWQAKLRTVADLLRVNAFECLLGALAEVMVQMTVADVFFVHQRGITNTVYVWFCQVGSNLAPVAAGYITLDLGWRWVWWVMAILFGCTLLVFAFGYEETKYSYEEINGIPLQESQDPLESLSNNGNQVKKAQTKPIPSESVLEEAPTVDLGVSHINPDISPKTYLQRLAIITITPGDFRILLRHSWQPMAILFTIPAVAFSSFFSNRLDELVPFPFIGSSLGALIVGPLSDRLILYLACRNNGIYEPEMRLWAMVPFIAFIPAGALMFGMALNDGRPWPICAVGYGMTVFGTTPVSSIALTYITDSYEDVVADSLVAVTFVRNALATVFVFSMTPWINNLGLKSFTKPSPSLVVLSFSSPLYSSDTEKDYGS